MKKVLIIAFYFPPNRSIASNRIGGIAKYLREYNWEPVILTSPLPGKPPENVRVIQTSYNNVLVNWKKRLGLDPKKGFQDQVGVKNDNYDANKKSLKKLIISKLVKIFNELVAFPDFEKGWYSFAIKEGERILAKEKFDLILSSSAPYTAHLIARYLKKKFSIPWVADFRDLWSQNHNYRYSNVRRIFERYFEKRIMLLTDAFVTVSFPLAEKLRKLHENKPVYAIQNGFDPDQMKEEICLSKKFIITYTGNIYKGKQDPTLLFNIIYELIHDKKIKREDVQIRFFGNSDVGELIEQWIINFKLQDILFYGGFISKEESLRRQKESQLLLLLNWTDPKEEGIYTGKIFEYLGAQRPIIAIGGSGGVVKELLEETNAGIHINNEIELRRVILQYYTEFKIDGTVHYNGNKEKVEQYSHKKMAEKFAQVFEKITTAY